MNDLAPKTVTFNPDSRTEAQHRSAQLGSRVVAGTLGLAAIVLAGVALIFNIGLAVDAAGNWREVIVLAAIAFGLTLALAGLPVAAVMMSRGYPAKASLSMEAWRGALALSALAGAFFVATIETPASRTLTAKAAARAEELRHELRYLGPEDWRVWSASEDCRRPSAAFRAPCADLLARRARQQAELDAIASGVWQGDGWSPGAVIGTGRLAALTGGSQMLRRLLILALSLAAVAGAGLLGQLGVLAAAESWRLGEGEATPLPQAEPAPLPAPTGAGMVTPADAFALWANGRLIPVAGAEVSGARAYEDYAETCRLNGIEPMAAGKFGTLLTARATASDGRILKQKSNGVMVYRGWELPGALIEVGPERFQPGAGL